MELIDVVTKLVGPVMPVGDSGIDLHHRQPSLKALCDLTYELLDLIEQVANMPDGGRGSIIKSKGMAAEFLAEVRERTHGVPGTLINQENKHG